MLCIIFVCMRYSTLHNILLSDVYVPEVSKQKCSFIPRPSLPPVFDCLQYAKTKCTASDQKLEVGKAWE